MEKMALLKGRRHVSTIGKSKGQYCRGSLEEGGPNRHLRFHTMAAFSYQQFNNQLAKFLNMQQSALARWHTTRTCPWTGRPGLHLQTGRSVEKRHCPQSSKVRSWPSESGKGHFP